MQAVLRVLCRQGQEAPFVSHDTVNFKGIGPNAVKTAGVRRVPLRIATDDDGPPVAGSIDSVELSGSSAPTLFSLKAQKILQLVHDVNEATVYSKKLERCLKVVVLNNGLHAICINDFPEAFQALFEEA